MKREKERRVYNISCRYNRVIDCCGLVPDLQLLPDGDETEVSCTSYSDFSLQCVLTLPQTACVSILYQEKSNIYEYCEFVLWLEMAVPFHIRSLWTVCLLTDAYQSRICSVCSLRFSLTNYLLLFLYPSKSNFLQ